MKARRPGRATRKDRVMRTAQLVRLQEIAAGRMQPHFEREHLFHWTLEARGRADPHDFIVPGLLFMAERLNQPFDQPASAVAPPPEPPPHAPLPWPVVPSPPSA
jgi:hypothetical protein